MAGRGKAKPQRGQHQGFKRSQLRQARKEAEKVRKRGRMASGVTSGEGKAQEEASG